MKNKIILFLVVISLSFAISSCKKKIELKDCPITHELEFGGIYIKKTIDEFNAMGFEFGDSVDIKFSNGYEMNDIPYYNGYYVQTGKPLLVGYPGYDYIKVGINNGDDLWYIVENKEILKSKLKASLNKSNDLWLKFDMSEDVTASITINKKAKYKDIQEARDIRYYDDRSKYESDEIFANFRPMNVGNLKENILYRSASPCDNQHNRAHFVDRLIDNAKVKYILNLADNESKISGYINKDDFNSPYFKTLYDSSKVGLLSLNTNFASKDFKDKLVNGLNNMILNDGPYLIHCTEGKDRTGFVCLLLEALGGATYDEIVEDYMITYNNYYKITKSDDESKYNIIVSDVLNPMIELVVGSSNIKNANLKECGINFLTNAGMTLENVNTLIELITK